MHPRSESSGPDGSAEKGLFPAFAIPNFRRFVGGQSVSLIGSWAETVAQAILVLQLTNSSFMVGMVTAVRYLPVLLLTPYAGVIVDRNDKRRILMIAESCLALLSVMLGALVLTGWITIWWMFAGAMAFGFLSALDNPARQAFIPEIVGGALVRNAVTLNSTFVNLGRAVGPIVAGVAIGTMGIGWCFIINAASFAAVLYALATMNVAALQPVVPARQAKGQLLDGFRYALTVPEIVGPIAMMAFIGTFAYEFEVSLPVFAHTTLAGTATTYDWLIGAFGFGSVLGGLYCIWRPATGMKRLSVAAFAAAVALAAVSAAPNLTVAVALLVVVGVASITFITTGNSTIQLASKPEYRGRVTALWSTAFLGSTPIGATIIGYVGGYSPRLAIFTNALACAAAGAVGLCLLVNRRLRASAHMDRSHK